MGVDKTTANQRQLRTFPTNSPKFSNLIIKRNERRSIGPSDLNRNISTLDEISETIQIYTNYKKSNSLQNFRFVLGHVCRYEIQMGVVPVIESIKLERWQHFLRQFHISPSLRRRQLRTLMESHQFGFDGGQFLVSQPE